MEQNSKFLTCLFHGVGLHDSKKHLPTKNIGEWWLWPWNFLWWDFGCSWLNQYLQNGCKMKCPRIQNCSGKHVILNTWILRKWIYCASLSLLWSLKTKNKHSFCRYPHKKWVPLLLIPSMSHLFMCTDRIQVSLNNDFVDITIQVSLKSNYILRHTHVHFLRFPTRQLKKVQKILERSLPIARDVTKLWQHSEDHLTFNM
jgi:hypothetical protein